MAFIAGVIAKFLMAGDNEPSGFILTTKASVVPHFRSNHISYNRADGSASMPLATRKFCRLLRDSPLLGLKQVRMKRQILETDQLL
jgi:hypothetical protein